MEGLSETIFKKSDSLPADADPSYPLKRLTRTRIQIPKLAGKKSSGVLGAFEATRKNESMIRKVDEETVKKIQTASVEQIRKERFRSEVYALNRFMKELFIEKFRKYNEDRRLSSELNGLKNSEIERDLLENEEYSSDDSITNVHDAKCKNKIATSMSMLLPPHGSQRDKRPNPRRSRYRTDLHRIPLPSATLGDTNPPSGNDNMMVFSISNSKITGSLPRNRRRSLSMGTHDHATESGFTFGV